MYSLLLLKLRGVDAVLDKHTHTQTRTRTDRRTDVKATWHATVVITTSENNDVYRLSGTV